MISFTIATRVDFCMCNSILVGNQLNKTTENYRKVVCSKLNQGGGEIYMVSNQKSFGICTKNVSWQARGFPDSGSKHKVKSTPILAAINHAISLKNITK